MCFVSSDPTQSTLYFYQSWDLEKAGATSVERISAQSYIGFVVSAKQYNIHIVVGNFSISRNKDYGCGSPCTDITTHTTADCSISYPSSSR